MSELLAQAQQGLFLLFMLVCTSLGITGLLWCVCELFFVVVARFLRVGMLMDGVREAQRLGRSPWSLRACKWRELSGRDD